MGQFFAPFFQGCAFHLGIHLVVIPGKIKDILVVWTVSAYLETC